MLILFQKWKYNNKLIKKKYKRVKFKKKMSDINKTDVKLDLYGLLLSNSINIENKQLISCLDDMLKIFQDYFKLINKV